jgi:hypothetical protein
MRTVGQLLWAVYGRERALLWTGLAGLALGFLGLIVMAVQGPVIQPEGRLVKAVTFDIAVGIYLLTLALYLPAVGFSPRGRARWRGASVALTLTAFAIENIQIYRGLDPRFSRVGTPVDQMIGGVFFLIALGLIALFLILSAPLVRRKPGESDHLIVVAIRYAVAATLLAIAAGLAMSANQGPRVGQSGNLLALHALGFHGLQAVPLVALLATWASLPTRVGRRWVHLAGVAWLGACAAVSLQTLAGRSVMELSTCPAVALALLVAWAVGGVRALRAWYGAGATLPYVPAHT